MSITSKHIAIYFILWTKMIINIHGPRQSFKTTTANKIESFLIEKHISVAIYKHEGNISINDLLKYFNVVIVESFPRLEFKDQRTYHISTDPQGKLASKQVSEIFVELFTGIIGSELKRILEFCHNNKSTTEETTWDLSRPRTLPWKAVVSGAYRTGMFFDKGKEGGDQSKVVVIKREDFEYPRGETPKIFWGVTKEGKEFGTTDENGNIYGINFVCGGRQSGKSTHLVKLSAETGKIIIVPNKYRIKHIMDLAKDLGLSIPTPICYDEKERIKTTLLSGRNRKPFLIDDAEYILSRLLGGVDIDTISFTSK